MKAEKDVDYLTKIDRLAKEYQSPETQRLIEIGRATVETFEGIYTELLIHDVWPSGDNKGTERIASVEELLEWHRAQEVQKV